MGSLVVFMDDFVIGVFGWFYVGMSEKFGIVVFSLVLGFVGIWV